VDVLGAEEGRFFADVYDVSLTGNWEGRSIPNRLGRRDRLNDADERRLATDRSQLLERRAQRVRPATDDKALADWNGLMIAALALAGTTFERPEWIVLAQRAFAFVTTTMARDGRLAHSWREGKSVYPGLATDYAAMIKAALALHAATLDAHYLTKAEALAASMRTHHWNRDEPSYFLSADDAEALIVRPKATTDEATPSATGLMAQNLIRLWRLTGKDAYRRDVDEILDASAAALAANLFGGTSLLNALDLRLAAVDLVVVAPATGDTGPLLRSARAHWTPNIVLSAHTDAAALPHEHPASGKGTVNGKPTAYVCRGESCSLPVTDRAALIRLLRTAPVARPS
jgi:uncharacterized protein YyaL (SSP411 family)